MYHIGMKQNFNESVSNGMKSALLLLFCMAQFAQAAPAGEEKLKEAIQLSNQGKQMEAVKILNVLAQENPSDDRVFLSLGLVYRSLQHFDDAIQSFERAVSINPSEEGYYSMGLLYEGKILRDEANAAGWTAKAKSAWNSFLSLKPSDARKADTAVRHLKHLNEAGGERR